MAEITYFVACHLRGDDGELAAGEAIECQTPGRVVREAERLSRLNAGAVAFSRCGDPSSDEFADAKVIQNFGEVPDLFQDADA